MRRHDGSKRARGSDDTRECPGPDLDRWRMHGGGGGRPTIERGKPRIAIRLLVGLSF